MTSSAAVVPRPAPADSDPNVWSEYEIEAQGSLVDRQLRNLKHGDAFAVLDSFGDIGKVSGTPEGIFYRDTRFLSHFELRIEGKRPLLLGSAALEDKAGLAVDLTNPDIPLGSTDKVPKDTIFLERSKFLWEAVCYERLKVKNYGSVPRTLRLDFLIAADFVDLFEVRGMKRRRRGQDLPPVIGSDSLELRYRGLDDVERRSRVSFFPVPLHITENRATLSISLAPQEYTSIFVTVSCTEGKSTPIRDFFISYRDTHRARRASTSNTAKLESSYELFRDVASRAVSDVYTLVTKTEHGVYPYAGIPWFSTIFGRDGIITAMLMLWMDPAIAKGVLRTLAAMQAVDFDAKSDAQPGKILHECRHGEMANLGEVPFRRYYGSVDSTPLFLMLAGMYAERTGDLETVAAIWPNILAALRWIDEFGDRDSDGFVEYHRETENGLANQGWKDSWDAIFHGDGSLASGSIALCEVQGYVFAARHAVARLSEQLGHADLAITLIEQAERLRQRFEQDFWCEEIGTYALALDGEKRPCRVRTSNAGHALFTGIAAPDRARQVAANLMRPESFSGWGIRTLGHGEPRYNPMSYHNGSVWPHDNALIALGLSRYGLRAEAARVFTGLFHAATYHELHRLPELFCGFNRRPHRGPTAYPVACSPQAWSAAAIPGLLAATLGLDLKHHDDAIGFREPWLPDFLDELVIRNLRLGETRVDLRFHRVAQDVAVRLLAREGPARVVVLK